MSPYFSTVLEVLERKVIGPIKVLHIGILIVYLAVKVSTRQQIKDTATASHILLKSKDLAQKIKKQIDSNEKDFETVAKEMSECPSGKTGGSLGQFSRGDMVYWFNSYQSLTRLFLTHP